ncbi:MAG: class I SAM-dependent methyltransferase [Anaerolineae bacterium]
MALPRFLLRQGFHLLYNQLAWTYDAVAWSVSFGQWGAWRRCAIPFLQPGPVLELAYGTGGLFVDLVRRGWQPAGIDLSPYMARLARRRLRRFDPRLPSPLVRAQAQALPFPSGTFANAVATFPTEYIMDPASLAEVRRVLWSENSSGGQGAPGQLIIVAEGKLKGPWPLQPLVEGLYRFTGQRRIPPAGPLPHLARQGFIARWETVTVDEATAHIVVAKRRN